MLPSLEQRAIAPADALSERQAMLARRLDSWLHSQPRPIDIIDAVYEAARQLDDAAPGGLHDVSGHLLLTALCRCLIYCEADDFLAVWPAMRSR
jgi:hypothetical protein